MPNNINERDFKGVMCGGSNDEVRLLCEFHNIDISSYKGTQRKDKIARNLVDYEVGLAIFNTARGIINRLNVKSHSLFDGVF